MEISWVVRRNLGRDVTSRGSSEGEGTVGRGGEMRARVVERWAQAVWAMDCQVGSGGEGGDVMVGLGF